MLYLVLLTTLRPAKKYDLEGWFPLSSVENLQGTSVVLELYRLSSKEARDHVWPEKAW